MDVDPPPGFGAPGDPPGGTNLPKPATTIRLGALLPPLPPKQGG